MSPVLRRALIIIGFILVVALFGFIIWYVFFRPSLPIGNTNRGGTITNGLPTPGNGNVNRTQPSGSTQVLPVINTPSAQPSTIANGSTTLVNSINTGPTAGLSVNPDSGNVQYYDKTNGLFYKISPDGSLKTPMTTDAYPDVQNVTWAPNGNQAVLEFPDGSKILYDFAKKKQTTLPSELNDFSFSPQSNQIAAKYLDAGNTDNQWLVVSNPDGTNSQTAEHLGDNASKVSVSWSPNNQIIAQYAKSVSGEQQQIIFLGANNENFPSVNVNGRGFTPNWSPDGRRMLYSTYSELTNDNPHLYIMNGSPESLGTGLQDLGLDTSADKCSFSAAGSTIYCAVPYYYNAGSGPQPGLSAGIPDKLYKVDLRTGTVSLIALPVDANNSQRFSMVNLQVAPDESSVFFTDATTGALQSISLR